MSWLGDVFNFEKFNLGDMWGKVKDNPARLLYGSADPFSTKMWNGILGTHDQPIIDQMGGASHDVYGKAQAAGINIGPGKQMQDLAHTIAAFEAGSYGANALGGGAGVGSGSVGDAGSIYGDSAALGGGSGGSAGLGDLSAGSPAASGDQWWRQLMRQSPNMNSGGNKGQNNQMLMAQLLMQPDSQYMPPPVSPAMPYYSIQQPSPYGNGLMKPR